jgi:gliding motility-associated-like protein
MKFCNSGKKYNLYALLSVLFIFIGISAFSNPLIDKNLLPPPVISPAGPVTFCKGGWLVVSNAGNNPTYLWQNGTSNIPNSNNDSLYVTTSGTYTCNTTSGGNSSTSNSVQVTIEAIAVTATSTSVCIGSSTTLTASGSTTGTYTWITPPATAGATITVSPTTNTTYSVWSDINSCRDTVSITISVKPIPTASYTYSPNSGCPRKKRKLYFNSTSQQNGAGNLSYSWDFGDPNSGSNNTSNNNNPDHSFVGSGFSSAGSFTVTLTVTAANGCSSTTSQVISIGSFPDASLYDAFNADQFAICDSNLLTVVNSSTTTAINTNYQIFWGDGTSTSASTMDSLSHAYLTTGSQSLVFIVSSGGCKDSSEYSVYIGSNPGIGLSTSGSTTLLCLPSTKTFFIDTTRTRNNPLGTLYTVVYNDGSPSQTYTHPPPASFDHTFTTTSCGATGGTFVNTFFVTIYASNPCGTTQAKVEPITTILPPKADFLISPDTVICVNSSVTLTNNSQNGNVVTQTGSGPTASFSCDATSSPFWTISAITGVNGAWTTTGALGVIPNNPGSQTITANFSQPGTYLIKLNVRSAANSPASCRNDDTTKVICVEAPPSPSFTCTPKIGCSPFNVNFNNTSVDPSYCSVATKVWTITKINAICTGDSASDYVYVSGTNSSSLNPIIRFNNQGTYVVTLSMTNKCGQFTSTPDTIVVKTKPQISVGALSTICTGQSVSPSSTILNCLGTISQYAWSFPGGTPSTSNQQSPGTVTFNTSGTQTISLAVTNECGTTTVTQPITINPTPTVTSVPNITKCEGQASGAINFSGSQAATVYSWSNSNTAIGLAASGTGNIPSFTLTNNTGAPITSTITVSPSLNNCTGNSISFTITVNPNPSISVNSATICAGSSATLTASGANTYSWSPATGLSVTTGATVTANPSTTTTYTITGTNTSTTCFNSTTSTVTVNTAPVISGSSLSNPATCASTTGSITLNGLLANTTYEVHYTAPTGVVIVNITSNASGNIIISGLPSGAYSNVYVVYNNCPSTPVGPFSLSDPSSPATPTALNNSALCSGATLNLTSSTSTTGTLSYNWTGPNGFTSNVQNPSIPSVSTAYSGTYSVTVSQNGCTSPAGTTNVIINETPATPTASSNSPVCSGNALTLSASTTSTMPVTWSWSGPNSYTSSNQNPQVSAAATTAMSGTYTVTATAAYTSPSISCPSNSATTTVTVNATPVISSSTSTSPSNCSSSTGSITLNGLSANTNYEVHYTGPAGAVIISLTSNASGVLTISSLPAGSYSNVYVVLNNCPSAPAGPFNLSDPNPPATPTATNNSALCSGSTLNLNATNTATGTATFTWSGPNGFSSNLEDPSIPNVTVAASGTYSVTVTINGCTSPAGTTTVVINQTPATPTPSSNTPVCTGNALTLSASTTSIMTVTWSWSGPNSFSSTNQNPQVSAAATTAMAGNYTVTATASYTNPTINCPSASASTTVVVNPTPAISSSSSTNPTNCATATGTILLNGLTANLAYEVHYTGPSGAPTVLTLTTNALGVLTIPTLLSGTYSNVYVVLTNCPSSPVGPFSLSDPNPPAAPVAANNSALCSGESLSLTATISASGSATWSWTGPNSFSSSSQNPTITAATTAATGVYSVTVTINSCTSPAGTTTVTINPRPVPPIVTSPVTYCQFATPTALTATALPGHTLQWYTVATGGTASNTAPTPSTSTTGTVSYYVSQVTPENCEGQRAQIDVIVNPTPVVTQQTQTICSGANFSITPSGSSIPSNTVYTWGLPVVTGGLTGATTGTNATSISGSLSNPTDFVQTATYTVTPTSGNCIGNTFTVIITVNPAPHVTFAPGNQNICSGTSSNAVTITSPTPGVNIPWVAITPTGITGVQNNGNNTIPSQTLINSTSNSITVTYSAVAITTGASGCPGDTSRYLITVNPKPLNPNQTANICSHETLAFVPTNNPPTTIVPSGTTYTWTYVDNPNVTGESNQSSATDTVRQTLINTSNTAQQVVYNITPTSGVAGNCVGSSFQLTVTVNPVPEIPTLSATICSGNSFTITPTNGQPNTNTIVPAGTTYSWSAPALPSGMSGAASGNNQTSISGSLTNTTFAPITITYVVTPISGASGNCAGIPFNVNITVNPLASISNNPLSQSVCNGNTTTAVNWTSFTSGSAYSWTVLSSGNVTGFLPAGNGPTLSTMTLTNTGIAQDSVVYAISSTASACAGPATPYTIYVNPDAKANFTYPYDTACWPYAIVINNTSAVSPGNVNIPNGSYNWYTISATGVNTFIGTGTNFPGYTILGPSESMTIKMVANSFFGCKNDSLSHTFYTKPKPTAQFSMSNRDSCGPLTVSFVNQTNIIDTFNYLWNFGNGQTSTLANPAPVIFLSNPRFYDTTYYVVMKAFNECDTSIYIDSVIVRADPKARFFVSSTSGCSPFTIQITNTSLGNAYEYYWDFGNGVRDTTFANGTFSYTYYTGVTDTFNLMLIAQNQCGRDTQIINVRVAPNIINPGVNINATELYGCVAHTVNFINSTSGATSFTWDFGDSSPNVVTSVFQNIVQHTYNTPGTFTVNIAMTNGCSDTSITKQVIVYPRPIAAFNTNQSTYCLGDTVRVNNTSTNSGSYLWNWGTGPSTSGFEPPRVYTVAGTFTILLQAQSTAPSGVVCYDTVSHPITVLNKPDSTIISNIGSANCSPFDLTASMPGIINETVTWTVYDTTIAGYPFVFTGPTLQYTFTNPGTFTIHMIAENAAGCKDSTTRTFTVYQKPNAGFTPLNLVTCSLDTLVGYVNTTTANNYTPLTYKWYVDGIQRATTGNFSYRYVTLPAVTLPRTFTTKLIATNSVGCADSVSGTLQMNPTAKSVFAITNPNACIPFVANITDNSNYATIYSWYLNGALVSNSATPSINITSPNTSYTITLIVSNSYACKPDTSSVTFRTRIMPKAIFSLNSALGCTGQLNVITTNTSQNANAYEWEWGDGTANSIQTNPTHLYTVMGTYRIILTAKDGVCTDTTSKLVVVARKPTVNFIVNNLKNCDTASVRLINVSSNADSYLWVLSNGMTSTAASPTFTLPPSNTPYTVQLIAYNQQGCKDSLTRPNYIRVIPPPAGDFYINPSPTISIPDYTFSFTNLTLNSILYQYSWSLGDGTFANTRDVPDHLYADTGSYPIQLIVLDTSTNCTDTVIKIARIQGYPGYLYVPNAFYPNSTRTEFKSFKPLGKGLAEYELQIFDSWGKLLFRSTKLDANGSPVEGWDGTFKGQSMPQDAYAWYIKAKFRSGQKWSGMKYNQNENGSQGHTFGTITLFR